MTFTTRSRRSLGRGIEGLRRHTPEYDAALAKQSQVAKATLRHELRGCFSGFAGALFAFGSLIVLFINAVHWGGKLAERLVISAAYGSDRYDSGLRIADKHFHLSDGT